MQPADQKRRPPANEDRGHTSEQEAPPENLSTSRRSGSRYYTITPDYQPERARIVSIVVEDNYIHEGSPVMSVFETKQQRKIFVRNVYALLALMLMAVAAMVAVALYVPVIEKFLHHNFLFYILSYAMFLPIYLSLVCCETLRRKTPINYIMLIVLTICMGFMLAMISVHHGADEVLFAAVGTLIVVICVTGIAAFCPCDVTGWRFYMFVAGAVLVVSALIVILVCMLRDCGEAQKYLQLGIAVVFVVLFSIYLIYDTQLVLGGRRLELDPDDYINGALHLWIDIINIFICFLVIARNT